MAHPNLYHVDSGDVGDFSQFSLDFKRKKAKKK